ncbi:Bgt-3996 [Blumeria graminis f. sp. tritici]|uniref:Ankyrin repeat protein n=3 Tax=Blumeria graminis f. sp. tritici TaxID=62690 RepID=A0A656KIY5_BLUGR|nr:hypothetical protein BGT96224_3996 [Blumeria graminis f. sp. tritici 96224]VDB95003.1 Bgt-3996 [Blumeria graminis f. sp. tritici]
MASPNLFLLAADHPSELITNLRKAPSLASIQDEHGYSLLHAAASYHHSDLLRRLVTEFGVDVNLRDEDGETALFVVETLECSKILFEELHADLSITNREGQTAAAKITQEEEFPEVADYLKTKEFEYLPDRVQLDDTSQQQNFLPPPPEGLSVNYGVIAPEELGEVVDQRFKMKIEELAARQDFEAEGGQQALRQLVTEAIRGEIDNQERCVRQKQG